MARYLHTMLRSSDIERTRPFLEALGFSFSRDLPIVRDGELEATNYFFNLPGDEAELEITVNHDGRTTTSAPPTATSRSAWTTWRRRSRRSPRRASSPSGRRTGSARAARSSASSRSPSRATASS